jgi:hypothetical protein
MAKMEEGDEELAKKHWSGLLPIDSIPSSTLVFVYIILTYSTAHTHARAHTHQRTKLTAHDPTRHLGSKGTSTTVAPATCVARTSSCFFPS